LFVELALDGFEVIIGSTAVSLVEAGLSLLVVVILLVAASAAPVVLVLGGPLVGDLPLGCILGVGAIEGLF
jgi:hypothetical protein